MTHKKNRLSSKPRVRYQNLWYGKIRCEFTNLPGNLVFFVNTDYLFIVNFTLTAWIFELNTKLDLSKCAYSVTPCLLLTFFFFFSTLMNFFMALSNLLSKKSASFTFLNAFGMSFQMSSGLTFHYNFYFLHNCAFI